MFIDSLTLSTDIAEPFSVQESALTVNPSYGLDHLSLLPDNSLEPLRSLTIKRVRPDNFPAILEALKDSQVQTSLTSCPRIIIDSLHLDDQNWKELCNNTPNLRSLTVHLTGSEDAKLFIDIMGLQGDGSFRWNKLAKLVVVALLDQHEKLKDMVADRGIELELFAPIDRDP